MTTPDTPASAPLDSERARLRSAGYTDAEISHILTQREIGASPQPAEATGQGVLSNVLSSILGVASHARALIPTFRKDVETVFDNAAAASVRAGATASLAVKAIVVTVLGFAAWQEWKQHIISTPELTRQQVLKATADALTAQAEADAATAKVTNPDQSAPRVLTAPVASIYSLCQESNRDYDSRIQACSDIVARGEETNENRFGAYINRALAYWRKGDRQHMLVFRH